jgi:hypothetical protein
MIRSFASHELTRDSTCSSRLTPELFQRGNAQRAQAYAFPAGWRQHEDEDKRAGSKVK